MKNQKIKNYLFLLALVCIAGCDDYERKGVVTPAITVNEHSLDMFVGETAQLKASPAGLSFTWTSEDTEVAAVDGNGLVTATGDGSTFIVAASGEMSCRVPVNSVTRISLKDFSINVAEIKINTGGTVEMWVTLDPTNANDASLPLWRSLNTDVATVDYKGVLTGAGTGMTEVVCTINGMKRAVGVTVGGK